MAKVVVIDWGPQQVRLLEADTRGSGAVLRKLTTLSLPEGQELPDSTAGRELVERALSAAGGAKLIGLVGRSQAVLRDLKVPNAPADELPGIVQFQAMRELSFPIEQAAIDFDLVGPADDSGRRVILAALQHEVIERYRGLLSTGSLRLSRLGLRPYATWRAYRQVSGTPEHAVLLLSIAGEWLELTVVQGSGVLFSRATLVRRGADGRSVDSPAIVAEVRRTLAAFANQADKADVRRVALAAYGDDDRDLADSLAAALSIPVDRFDPFRAVELGRGVADSIKQTDSPAAYVAAIGAALAADEPWPIDFLNPKKPVVRPDRRKPMLALGAAAAVLLALAAWSFVHLQLSAGERELTRLLNDQAKLQEKLKSGEDLLRRHQAVEDWLSAETDCLQQLRRLTEEFPDTKQMYANMITVGRENTPAGLQRIELDAIASDQLAISSFSLKMNRDGPYSAQLTDRLVASGSGPYNYPFKANLVAKPTSAKEPTKDGDGEVEEKAAGKPDSKNAESAEREEKPQEEAKGSEVIVIPVSSNPEPGAGDRKANGEKP